MVGAVDLSGVYTTFRMIAAETIGVDYELVRVVGSDSGNAPYSGGSGGSKIIYTVGQAVQRAAGDAKEQILDLAAQLLEAAPQDLEITGDRVRVKGMPAEPAYEVTIAKIASLTSGFGARHAPIAGRGTGAQTANAPGFSAHLARVRVDLDTGEVALLDYVATQDVGRALNPSAVEGQIIGAVAQGIGWGLYEQMMHDESGQMVTGTLMDYALPRADWVPDVRDGAGGGAVARRPVRRARRRRAAGHPGGGGDRQRHPRRHRRAPDRDPDHGRAAVAGAGCESRRCGGGLRRET